MLINVSCETFARLAEVARTATDPRYPWLKSVAFHRKNGQLVAIASNASFCAIELIGKQDGPEAFLLVPITENLVRQCVMEKEFNGMIAINYDEAHSFASLVTTFGFTPPGNVGIFPVEHIPLKDWRSWLPREIGKNSTGCVFIDVDGFNALARSSPSGCLVFPRYMDVEKAVPIADITAKNWLGLFYPKTKGDNAVSFDKFEDWVNK